MSIIIITIIIERVKKFTADQKKNYIKNNQQINYKSIKSDTIHQTINASVSHYFYFYFLFFIVFVFQFGNWMVNKGAPEFQLNQIMIFVVAVSISFYRLVFLKCDNINILLFVKNGRCYLIFGFFDFLLL